VDSTGAPGSAASVSTAAASVDAAAGSLDVEAPVLPPQAVSMPIAVTTARINANARFFITSSFCFLTAVPRYEKDCSHLVLFMYDPLLPPTSLLPL
jgi:hypothetical protein